MKNNTFIFFLQENENFNEETNISYDNNNFHDNLKQNLPNPKQALTQEPQPTSNPQKQSKRSGGKTKKDSTSSSKKNKHDTVTVENQISIHVRNTALPPKPASDQSQNRKVVIITKVNYFAVWLRNRLISAELKPALSHTEY